MKLEDQSVSWIEALLRKVGEFQRQSRQEVSVNTADYKGHIDLVTRIDRESEHKLVNSLRERFPDDSILAEEEHEQRGNSGRRWIIDPLDGTTNYVHDHPFYGISVALEVDSKLGAGFAYFPELDEFYHAVRDQGAFRDEEPLSLTGPDNPEQAFLATGFADMRGDGPRINPEIFIEILPQVQGIRRGGSAVHDLCSLAAGVFDGFWEFSLAPWDVAAGGLIVREAGGIITDIEGGNQWVTDETIVAGTPEIQEFLLREINRLQ